MDIRQLRYFVKIVELGSLTKAAEALRIAQPALGLQIRKLEEELQVPLLIRHSRGVEETEAGKVLLARAQVILRQVDETKQELRDFAVAPRGRVVLGMTPSTNFMLGPDLIRRVSQDYPQLSLSVVEELSQTLIEWTQTERLDLSVCYRMADVRELRSEDLLEEHLYFVEAAVAGRNAAAEIEFAEVARHPLILPGLPHGLRLLVEEAAAGLGLSLMIPFEMQSVAAVRDLVLQGVAGTVLPFGALGAQGRDGSLVARRIVGPEISRTLCLLYSARRSLSKAERALLSLVKTLVKERVGRGDGIWLPPRTAAVSR